VAKLREQGQRTVFVTNNSAPRLGDYLAKLERCGIPTEADDVITSAQAAASLVKPGATALVCAGPGAEEALLARQVHTIRRGRADAVVVGWHRDFDFERLTAAFEAVHGGAPLLGTNDDATYPTPDGLVPGGGAILAAVAYASGAIPTVAGKPHDAMVALVLERVADPVIMVGDRPSTDGLFAERLGIPFALVLSGVTKEPTGARVAKDLADLVAQTYA
jgi:4-nitrophenyl phosphatase